MKIKLLHEENLELVMHLFCKCFQKDHYYTRVFGVQEIKPALFINAFAGNIAYCLKNGIGIGVFDEGRLIAFALLIDYNKTKNNHPDVFKEIFGVAKKSTYNESLHDRIRKLTGDTFYLLSICVNEDFRGQGIASGLIDYILELYGMCNIVSDVSNEASLPIYRKRNFSVYDLEDEYFYVEHHRYASTNTVCFNSNLHLLVPSYNVLERFNIVYKAVKTTKCVFGYEIKMSGGIEIFAPKENNVCFGCLAEVDYSALLEYQRLLNISQINELIKGDYILYTNSSNHAAPSLMNATLKKLIKDRQIEWSIIPDVFVSIPVQYQNLSDLMTAESDCDRFGLLEYMDFRTSYEAGLPANSKASDDSTEFKKRIQRFYLGKIKIVIYQETNIHDNKSAEYSIGSGALVDMYISVDDKSDCAVLTLCSLSAPFLISHLFDSVIRNQIMVSSDGTIKNLYDFVNERYRITKKGSPKIFAVIPKDKKSIPDNAIASLLACETIYPEGENFGKIIDGDILTAMHGEHGMGQYDRAYVCAYSNAVLQFSESFRSSVDDRLVEESITLFYIEMILFEEAAINITNHEIRRLLTSNIADNPLKYLSMADTIYDRYSKTTDFWSIKVNYPTSQKSISMLRKAFGVEEQVDVMQRSQSQLQLSINSKCNIIDRKDAKRTDASLAIISLLAFFSALIDGYDYIATWNDVFSPLVIHGLQKILFVAILISAVYTIFHLFGCKKIKGKNNEKKE